MRVILALGANCGLTLIYTNICFYEKEINNHKREYNKEKYKKERKEND